MLSIRKVLTLPLQKQNAYAPGMFHTNSPPQHLRAEAKFWKIGWIPLEMSDFCKDCVQVEGGKCENTCRKYMRIWNFAPKFPPSASAISSKIFENRLNAFKDIGFLLGQCTGWKLEISNVVVSACLCKSKIHARLKFSTQMPTFSIFELKPSFEMLKMLKVRIWVKNFRCADILVLQWQGENIAHRKHLKFPTNMYTFPEKILCLQRY